MAEISDDGIKFVTIKYDKNKLGKIMTIVPFKVIVASTGQEHAQSAKILKDLYAHSTDNITWLALSVCPLIYSRIFSTRPAPTVRPPSRIAKRCFSSKATGAMSLTSILMVSPGITISTPSGKMTSPVTSVVRM